MSLMNPSDLDIYVSPDFDRLVWRVMIAGIPNPEAPPHPPAPEGFIRTCPAWEYGYAKSSCDADFHANVLAREYRAKGLTVDVNHHPHARRSLMDLMEKLRKEKKSR